MCHGLKDEDILLGYCQINHHFFIQPIYEVRATFNMDTGFIKQFNTLLNMLAC